MISLLVPYSFGILGRGLSKSVLSFSTSQSSKHQPYSFSSFSFPLNKPYLPHSFTAASQNSSQVYLSRLAPLKSGNFPPFEPGLSSPPQARIANRPVTGAYFLSFSNILLLKRSIYI